MLLIAPTATICNGLLPLFRVTAIGRLTLKVLQGKAAVKGEKVMGWMDGRMTGKDLPS